MTAIYFGRWKIPSTCEMITYNQGKDSPSKCSAPKANVKETVQYCCWWFPKWGTPSYHANDWLFQWKNEESRGVYYIHIYDRLQSI